ncbi:DHA2 family efflux MFS transporter permease subunit [Gryllotalpicola protaetiae]|uniref:DHA2 family efflux MFS transporter permease subunit n=1 Tax=Gryllotalpicola protaetiae TaxID=2419771 RepID=A0A387BWV4_9MICO|nr:DHA2 family efflux MFS transporter permease subunit [Gryllotalpicola protaetiae]
MWRVIWTALVGGLAVLFDTTIVAVALHTLATKLDASVATIQWVSTGYLLALAVVMPVTGWAQRTIGRKRVWMIALTVFMVGSILSSLAWNVESLIAFRALQGVGGGALMPLMGTIVVQASGGKNLGRIMSIIGIPIVLGPVLGPVLGGLILQNLSWPWLFWVNVPVCLIGLVMAALFLPKDPAVTRAHFDAVGFVLLAPGLVALLYGLSNAGQAGGFAQGDVEVPLIGGVILVAGFVWWALRHRGKALLDLQLLKYWPLASASLVQFFSGVSLIGAMLLVPLYFQELRGTSALGAGLILIAQGAGALAVRSFIGRLSDRFGARWLVVTGFFIVLLGTVPFAFADTTTNWVTLIAALFVRGLGLGVVTTPLMTVGFRGLPGPDVPDASIISRVSQQLGGSFGGAVLTVILAGAATTAAATGAHGLSVAAFQQSFWWATGFTALGVALSFLLPASLPAAAPHPGGAGTKTEESAPAAR